MLLLWRLCKISNRPNVVVVIVAVAVDDRLILEVRILSDKVVVNVVVVVVRFDLVFDVVDFVFLKNGTLLNKIFTSQQIKTLA